MRKKGAYSDIRHAVRQGYGLSEIFGVFVIRFQPLEPLSAQNQLLAKLVDQLPDKILIVRAQTFQPRPPFGWQLWQNRSRGDIGHGSPHTSGTSRHTRAPSSDPALVGHENHIGPT